jgi:hypothetical protein
MAVQVTPRLQPPTAETPLDPVSGEHSQAWAEHHQKVADALATLGTGVVDGSDAAAGRIGECMSSVIAYPGSGISTAIPANVTTLALTAGDWDVSGSVQFVPAAASKQTVAAAGVSLTSAALNPPPSGSFAIVQTNFAVGGAQQVLPTGQMRVNVAAPTTVYLVAQAVFTVSTMTACGTISARRMR